MSAEQSILKQTPPSPTFAEDRFPRGAEILIEALVHEGVDAIFGYPGGAVLHIYDELWRARDPITPYLVRHEQGGVHMAESYARSSGPGGRSPGNARPGAAHHGAWDCQPLLDINPRLGITPPLPLL